MKTIRLRELPNWPPQPGGAYDRFTRFPLGGKALITEVFPVNNSMVTFRGEFEGNQHSYHLKAEDEGIASQIHTIICKNVGKTVAELGELEIEK